MKQGKSAPLIVLPVAMMLLACGQQIPEGNPSPAATASPAATTFPEQSAEPSPSPTASPTSAVTPAPSPAPSVPFLEPDAAPQIVAVSISETTLHSGDTVSGEVITSSNVASVEVRIGKIGMSIPKTAPGHFNLTYTVPKVPFYLRKRYEMRVIARNTRGEEASTSLEVAVQR